MKNILRPNCVYDTYDDEKHEHYPVTQLLIEGAPGIGKSTFAWEVCHKWGQHQLFNEYKKPGVFLICFTIHTPSCSLKSLITLPYMVAIGFY